MVIQRSKQTIQEILDRVREPAIQLSVITGLILYLVVFLYWQHAFTHYADPIPQIPEVSARTKELSSKVTAGIHINNFPVFSFDKNEFVLDAVVWFRFPVGSESLRTIEQFSFQNGEIIRKSSPIVRTKDKMVTISYQTVARIKTQLSYAHFPLSDHRLSIILENRTVTPNELYFDSNADLFALADHPSDLMVSTWRPQKKTVRVGYVRSILSEDENDESEISYPCVACTIDFTNNSIRDLISLYLPMFMVFFIAFFALLIDIREHSLRTTLIAGATPTLVLFRLVIDNNTPEASNITKVDYLYYILVFLSLVLLLFQVYILLVERRMNKMSPQSKIKRYSYLENMNSAVFLFMISFLIGSFTLTHMWI